MPFVRLRNLCFIQQREDINMRRKLSNRHSIVGKTGKGFDSRLASWALPEMANNSVIQKFGLMGCNDFVIASNTVDSEHASLLHHDSPASDHLVE
jgi:hypothetical protein